MSWKLELVRTQLSSVLQPTRSQRRVSILRTLLTWISPIPQVLRSWTYIFCWGFVSIFFGASDVLSIDRSSRCSYSLISNRGVLQC